MWVIERFTGRVHEPCYLLTRAADEVRGDCDVAGYRLRRTAAGWRCTCPGFAYRQTCKHAAALATLHACGLLGGEGGAA